MDWRSHLRQVNKLYDHGKHLGLTALSAHLGGDTQLLTVTPVIRSILGTVDNLFNGPQLANRLKFSWLKHVAPF